MARLMPETYRKILLTRGLHVLVDACDYGWLSGFKWHASGNGPNHLYAARSKYQAPGLNLLHFSMHREILGLGPGDRRWCDHINGNTLDNRRKNLRIVTPAQNALNRGKPINNTSGFKGVQQYRGCSTYFARCRIHGYCHEKNGFKTAFAAYRWYSKKVRELHGEYARIR